MSENLYISNENNPLPMSSVSLAIRRSPKSAQDKLLALYLLQSKFRSLSQIVDPAQKYKTIAWWHEQISATQDDTIKPSQPHIAALAPEIKALDLTDSLLNWLAVQEDWLNVSRINSITDLNYFIDKMAIKPMMIWVKINALHSGMSTDDIQIFLANPLILDLIRFMARQIWWIDQLRHLGHQLNPSRIWIPIEVLKRANVPAHLLLQWASESNKKIEHLVPLAKEFSMIIQQDYDQYQQTSHALKQQLNKQQWRLLKKIIKGPQYLLRLRISLMDSMLDNPREIFLGLVTLGSFKKIWPHRL